MYINQSINQSINQYKFIIASYVASESEAHNARNSRHRHHLVLLTNAWFKTTSNLNIADRSRVSCARKLITVNRSPKWPWKVTQDYRKCHSSTERIWFPITVPE